MPLTAKGQEILSAMKKEYGSEKGEEVFYASKNAGKITGVDRADMSGAKFDELSRLFSEFLKEESREPEHRAADSVSAKLDRALARMDAATGRGDTTEKERMSQPGAYVGWTDKQLWDALHKAQEMKKQDQVKRLREELTRRGAKFNDSTRSERLDRVLGALDKVLGRRRRADADDKTSLEVTLVGRPEHVAQVADFLRHMEFLGNIGASRTLQLDVDGDGAGRVEAKFKGKNSLPKIEDKTLDQSTIKFGLN